MCETATQPIASKLDYSSKSFLDLHKTFPVFSLKEAIRAWTNSYTKDKRASDPGYRVVCNLRSRLLVALKRGAKAGSAVSDLGCSIEFLRSYLEKRFQLGMNWENYGKKGWHIDHITPLSAFDLNNREQFLSACHYTNLQPLWWYDNLEKGANV